MTTEDTDRETVLALQLTMSIETPDDILETWEARVLRVDAEDGQEIGSVARATIYRAHLERGWFDLMDSIDSDVAGVAEAFLDNDAVGEADEDSVFAVALSIIDYVEVDEEARGEKISHELVRLYASVFRTDAIALRPANLSTGSDGEYVVDELKHRALTRHWKEMGFVPIPTYDVMLLPLGAR
ncbi:hypothetical protein [Microbacterium sp. GXF7504]